MNINGTKITVRKITTYFDFCAVDLDCRDIKSGGVEANKDQSQIFLKNRIEGVHDLLQIIFLNGDGMRCRARYNLGIEVDSPVKFDMLGGRLKEVSLRGRIVGHRVESCSDVVRRKGSQRYEGKVVRGSAFLYTRVAVEIARRVVGL